MRDDSKDCWRGGVWECFVPQAVNTGDYSQQLPHRTRKGQGQAPSTSDKVELCCLLSNSKFNYYNNTWTSQNTFTVIFLFDLCINLFNSSFSKKSENQRGYMTFPRSSSQWVANLSLTDPNFSPKCPIVAMSILTLDRWEHTNSSPFASHSLHLWTVSCLWSFLYLKHTK